MRVSLSKNQSLVFSKFLRKYKEALDKFSIEQMMCVQKVQQVLGYLGYIDQYITEHTQQLSHTISFMLSEHKDCIVTIANLFEFLRLISDIKRYPTSEFSKQKNTVPDQVKKNKNEPLVPIILGSFSQIGEWKCTLQEETQVKKIFGSMNLKRISRQKIEAEQKENSQFFQEQTFKPQILEKSRSLAKQRYKKVSLSKSKVQDRLLLNQSLQKSRLEAEVGKSIQKEMKQCYFRPKINSTSKKIINSSLCKYIDSMNTSFENKENEKSFSNVGSHQGSSHSISKSKASKIGQKLLNKGKEYQQNLQKLKDQYKQLNDYFHMKQCTFQPKLYQKAYHNAKKPYTSIINQSEALKIRNADKSIERMKQARRQREFENQVKQRGYPQNVAWTKFMNSHKNQTKTEVKSPILCIDLKIMDSTRNIKVYEGQAVEQITQKICIQNSVPHEFWCKVQNLLKLSIQQCDQVKINNDRIYLNK